MVFLLFSVCICVYLKRGCNNVRAIVYMNCGKKRERGGISGGDNASGLLEGIERGPRRKGSREKRMGFSEKERKM